MTFGEVTQMVVDTVKRQDKVSDARTAVNQAIAFFASANFPNDRVEIANFSIDGTLYAQSFDITDAGNFTRFKVIDYIRPSGYNKILDHRDPAKVFDQKGRECLDVWYRSGNNIIFKLSRLQTVLKLGYFQYHATLTDDDDTDWILDEMTIAVHDFAAGRVSRMIGEDAEGERFRREAMLGWEAYKGSVAHT